MASILITGCGSGLGASLAQILANEGHSVIATVRSLTADIQQCQVKSHSGSVENRQMDVTNPKEIKAVFEQLYKNDNSVDVVILNAASYAMGTIETAVHEQIRQCFEVNYWGNVNVVRQTLPYMREQQGGKIIAIGSISSKVGLPCDGYYSATKAALECTLESLRYEVAPFGIHVSTIAPAAFSSNLFKTLSNESFPDSPYSPLLSHWLKNINNSNSNSNSNSNKEEHLKEIHQLVQHIIKVERPDFLYPVGDKASQIMTQLQTMSAEQRSEAILTWSDTAWWSANHHQINSENK